MIQYAYVAGTFDTKGKELTYLADRLRASQVQVQTVDLSTGGAQAAPSTHIDFSASDVALHHPDGRDAVLGATGRGSAIAAMASALRHFVISRTDLGGIIGAGGSGGTALLAPAMQALPIGVPKVLVSTVASGNVAAYVGASDIALMYSVTDVQGLNTISRRVLGNAAHALAGMMTHAEEIGTEQLKPALGLSMFGVTTPCVQKLCRMLELDYDCLVFHATGTGGQSMEKLADSGLLSAVIDITTTEVADLLVGGVFPATEDRFGAIIRQQIPYIGSVGALDMVNFGALNTVPGKWAGRRLHVHNPQVTLMRTSIEENRRIGVWIAERINRMHGPVRFLIPEKGVSLIDAEGEVFHDPEADAALFEALESTLRTSSRRQLIRVPAALNDDAFAAAVVEQFRSMV